MDLKRQFTLLLLTFILTILVNGDENSSSLIADATKSAPTSTLSSITEQTKVPAINNQNVTSVVTEMTTITSSALNISENQLKVSTTQFNLITSTVADVRTTSETEVTPSSDDELITQEQHRTSTEDADTNSDSTISFGIRSFTVEVSSKTEKLSATTAVPKSTTESSADAIKQTETMAGETFMPTASVNAENPISTEKTHSYSMDNVLKSNLNILFNNDDETELKMSNNNDMSSSHENEISNEIQIDKKLDNGLYRIKIGEITTDEFNTAYDEEHKDKLHQQLTKVNIDDFFPSKIEDFRPIIEISNEKMLKEKDVLHNEQVKPFVDISLTEASTSTESTPTKTGTRINTSNVATSNIEIELIDDSTVGINSDQNDRGIEIDEIITQVEEIVTEVPQQVTENINTDNVFIPRRSKKFDPSTKQSDTQGPTRIHDFGMTKFNQKKEQNSTQATVNGKPEYSTTKFYNSKELYNEILHKASKSSGTATLASSTAKPPSNLIREKLLNTNKIPIDISRISTTTVDAVMTTSTTTVTTPAVTTKRPTYYAPIPTSHPRMLSRLEEKLNMLDCDIQNLSADSTVWRGNETHELNLPITVSCSSMLLFYYFFMISMSYPYTLQAPFFCVAYASTAFIIDFDFSFLTACVSSNHPSSENLIEIRYMLIHTHISEMYKKE